MSDLKDTQPLDRRAKILAIATEAFVTNGYAGTSMADLASSVGIQKASIYHHFPSKQSLFIACVTEGYEGALQKLEAIRADASLSDANRIRTAMAEIYRVNLTTPVGRMAPLIAEVAPNIPEVARAFHGGFIARHYALVTGMIEDGIARGSFTALDPIGLRQMIFGPIIFLAMEREMTADFADRDQLNPVDHIRQSHIDLILRLLTSPPPSHSTHN
ncbi:MAG: TetR/AcrR family transcriptional regulator [Loktanella sp.]|nr:TetR/AcrR family transcriptional regulator [Loktanella sp.]